MEVNEKPVYVYRGNYIESTHEVHIAVVDTKGNLLHYYGDPMRPTFARSSMKPFQAVPLIQTGAAKAFNYQPKEVAISCASHSGEDIHRHTVLHILDKINLGEDALQCGTHPPRDQEIYKALIRDGKELTPVFSNCSGKHSGMLATAVHMGEDPITYRDIEHPVQQRILKVIAEVCKVAKEGIELGVDGCGVPVHRIPLYNVAFGYAKVAQPHHVEEQYQLPLKTIRDSMMKHPEMIGGKERFDTDVMRIFGGKLIAKGGAEGVLCIGLVDQGLGIAIKVEDGNARATSAIGLKVLKDIGFADQNKSWPDDLKSYEEPAVTNMRKDAIGKIVVDFKLKGA
ncbi:asparaginase [Scopulibacillus cellulosilyticus]|uniref:Asparaginase n=1 Tax=Scopulibacillus cellulosilyticus TaxID=2665665 RepID=A0ABW2Q6Y4_9BACL